jgi:hypothetical protein
LTDPVLGEHFLFTNYSALLIWQKQQQCSVVCSRKLRDTAKRTSPTLLPGSLLTATACSAKQTVKLATVQHNDECKLITKSPVPPSVIEVNFQNDRISKDSFYISEACGFVELVASN